MHTLVLPANPLSEILSRCFCCLRVAEWVKLCAWPSASTPGVCWTAALLFGGAEDRCLSPISAQTKPAPLDGEWVPFAGESALGRFEQAVNVHPGVRQHVIAIVTVGCRRSLRI
jgi:hypothetical protein